MTECHAFLTQEHIFTLNAKHQSFKLCFFFFFSPFLVILLQNFTQTHSVLYDPISAHFFPCGYNQNLTMQYESI